MRKIVNIVRVYNGFNIADLIVFKDPTVAREIEHNPVKDIKTFDKLKEIGTAYVVPIYHAEPFFMVPCRVDDKANYLAVSFFRRIEGFDIFHRKMKLIFNENVVPVKIVSPMPNVYEIYEGVLVEPVPVPIDGKLTIRLNKGDTLLAERI